MPARLLTLQHAYIYIYIYIYILESEFLYHFLAFEELETVPPGESELYHLVGGHLRTTKIGF